MPAPRLPRPAFTLNEYIQSPSGGWSPDVPPWELPANQAPLLENFIIRPGKIQVRPSFKVSADLSSSSVSLAGLQPFGQTEAILTRRLVVAGGNVEPQNLLRVGGAGISSALAVAEAATYEINGSTVTRHALANIGLVPGWRYIDFGGNRYALSYASTVVSNFASGTNAWITQILKVTDPATITALGSFLIPRAMVDIYGYNSRVYCAAGLSVGMATPLETAVFFSNPITTITGATTDWTDPVSGLTNQFVIDNNHLDPLVGMASVPSGLLLFRLGSIFIMRGTDPTNAVIRPVTKKMGLLDVRSIVELDNSVYFMSEHGLMVTDGISVSNVSGPLLYELQRQISAWNSAVYGAAGAYCVCTATANGKIIVTFGVHVSNGTIYPMTGNFSALFDPGTGAWVTLSTAIAPVGTSPAGAHCIGPTVSSPQSMWSLGNAQFIQVENKQTTQTLDGGSPSLCDQSTTGGTLVPITAKWQLRSPQAALGGRAMGQLKRIYTDYSCYTNGAPATLTTSIADRQTSTSLASYALTPSTAASGGRQTQERDDAHEFSDLSIEVDLAGGTSGGASTAAVPSAEINGVGIEFQPSRDMRQVN